MKKRLLNNLFLIIFLWALFCPDGHLVYFTEREFKEGDSVCAEDFFTNNKGIFYKGFQYPMWWGNPKENQAAFCPIDNERLRFEIKYLEKIK